MLHNLVDIRLCYFNKLKIYIVLNDVLIVKRKITKFIIIIVQNAIPNPPDVKVAFIGIL